ncbi:MAG: hypothetical protein U5L46_07455 [Agrobacterium sp.]|nr:hypothetical protein [Agrobacterium sp.]
MLKDASFMPYSRGMNLFCFTKLARAAGVPYCIARPACWITGALGSDRGKVALMLCYRKMLNEAASAIF